MTKPTHHSFASRGVGRPNTRGETVIRIVTQQKRLGILGKKAEDIEAALRERDLARKAKDFARSDAIRKELAGDGIEVADSPAGSTWRIGPI